MACNISNCSVKIIEEKNRLFMLAAARNLIRNESPQSVESPKLTPSPPSNVPPNIHHVISIYRNNNPNYYSNKSDFFVWTKYKYRQITVERHIFTQRPQTIRQHNRIARLFPNHRCQYRSRVIRRTAAIRNQFIYTQGQHQM